MTAKEESKDVFVLQNSRLRLVIADGRISSLVDTQQEYVIYLLSAHLWLRQLEGGSSFLLGKLGD